MIDVVQISRLFSKYHAAELRVGGLYAIYHSKEQVPVPISLIHPTTLPTGAHPTVPHRREPHAKGTLSRLSHVFPTMYLVNILPTIGTSDVLHLFPKVARSCQCRPRALYTAHGTEYTLPPLATRCHPIFCKGFAPILGSEAAL